MLKNKFIFNWGISKNPNKKIIKIKKGIKMLFIFKMLEIFFLKIKKQNKQINMQVIILEIFNSCSKKELKPEIIVIYESNKNKLIKK